MGHTSELGLTVRIWGVGHFNVQSFQFTTRFIYYYHAFLLAPSAKCLIFMLCFRYSHRILTGPINPALNDSLYLFGVGIVM